MIVINSANRLPSSLPDNLRRYSFAREHVRTTLFRYCNKCEYTINLIPPNTLFEDRLRQLDARFSRLFQMGKVNVRGNVDVYNLLNASAILNVTTRYGNQWLQPVQIMAGACSNSAVNSISDDGASALTPSTPSN